MPTQWTKASISPLVWLLIAALRPDEARLRAAAADGALRATERVLTAVKQGAPFRDAYRAECPAVEHR